MEKFYLTSPHNSEEIIGKQFGKWTIIEKVSNGLFLMRCDCGVEKIKKSLTVIRDKSKQCLSCYKKERRAIKRLFVDKHQIVGTTINRWSILSFIGNGMYKCQCECGHECEKTLNNLQRSERCFKCYAKEKRAMGLSAPRGFVSK